MANNEYTNTEKLQKLYENYLKCCKDRENGKIKKKFLQTYRGGFYNILFNKFVEIFEISNKPKVLRDSEYNQLIIDEFYHGFTKYEHGNSFLNDESYYTGGGILNGFFSTSDFDEALLYTKNPVDSDSKNFVLKFVILSENYIRVDDINNLSLLMLEGKIPGNLSDTFSAKLNDLLMFFNKIEDQENRKEFTKILLSQSFIAAYLGFDYIEVPHSLNTWTVILNRGVIAVSESEYKKFKDGAEKEKGGKKAKPEESQPGE